MIVLGAALVIALVCAGLAKGYKLVAGDKQTPQAAMYTDLVMYGCLAVAAFCLSVLLLMTGRLKRGLMAMGLALLFVGIAVFDLPPVKQQVARLQAWADSNSGDDKPAPHA